MTRRRRFPFRKPLALFPFAMVVAISAATLTLPPGSASSEPARDGKKGVSAVSADGATEALGDVGAGWFYTWATDTQGITAPEGSEFVPMIWGADSVNQEQLDQAKESGTTLLGFNEPDMSGQANMPVDQALSLWPQLEATGMRLGAPAVSHGADQEGGWLDQFMAGAADRGNRVDFIPLHWYGSDFSPAAVDHLRGYLEAVHDRYQKPIWLTEYALIDFSSGSPRYPSPEEQERFVRDAKAMLEELPFVERYAWFTLNTATSPTGLYDGSQPNSSGTAYKEG